MADAPPTIDVALTLRSVKGAPLTGDEVDANFQALLTALQEVARRGPGGGLADVEFDPDTGVVTLINLGGYVLGTFQLPSRPVRPRGDWGAGVAYLLGDLVRVPKGAIVPLGLLAFVTRSYTSDAADPAVDLGNGALLPLVYDGQPAQTPKGTYNAYATYALGDVVYYPATGTYYQLMSLAPAGTGPGTPIINGASYVFPWAAITVATYRALRIRADGKPAAGAVVLRELLDRATAFGSNFNNTFAGTVGPLPIVKAKTGPAAAVTFKVMVNGTQVGSISFAQGATVATFSTPNSQPYMMSAGDLVEVLAPATADNTLADVYGFLNALTL